MENSRQINKERVGERNRENEANSIESAEATAQIQQQKPKLNIDEMKNEIVPMNGKNKDRRKN